MKFRCALLLALALPLVACDADNAAPLSAPSPDAGDAGADAPVETVPWLESASVQVNGHAANDLYLDCRDVICRHNENTDLTTFQGAVWFVHRTAISQTLGPNSALHVYRSTDQGVTFTQMALLPAPTTRDIRDPCFYQVNGELYLKALTRLPVDSSRDSNVDTVAVGMHSPDGINWSAMEPIGPHGWSFWRVKEQNGVYYTAAYQDGDLQVVLYTSTDGVTWTAGPPIYTVSADTPLETELTFMPGGMLLGLVRMDGTDDELLGDEGRLRTKICWSSPPYTSFSCPDEFDGERLDGPVTFFAQGRLFVVARQHLQGTGGKKRTALYEITGELDGGPIYINDWGQFPSAGDTSYAGVAMLDPSHFLVTWYSGDIPLDQSWVLGMFNLTDIWKGTIDLSKLQ